MTTPAEMLALAQKMLAEAEKTGSEALLADAYKAALSAATAQPLEPRGWYLLGSALHQGKRWSAAVAAYKRCWHLGFQSGWTSVNIGWNLHLCGRSEEAEGWLRRGLALDPSLSFGHTNLSQVCLALGRASEAVTEAERGILLNPESHPAAHMALSFALLQTGALARGFREFEARIRFKMPEILKYPIPRWRGEPVEHLFLLSEQGFGDTLMAWRWVASAASRAKRVSILIQPELVSLLAANAPSNVSVAPLPAPLPTADAFCPLMSLPTALSLADSDFPSLEAPAPAYLASTPGQRAFRLRLPGDTPKIGLVWAGSAEHDMDAHRSLPFEEIAWLIQALPGFHFVSLQAGPRAAELEERGFHGLVESRTQWLLSFADTARELESLDMLVSVDTATAHLAGALGVSTVLLMGSHGQDWRWELEHKRTRWYESVGLWRRQRGEPWRALLERLAESLKARFEPDALLARSAE